MTTRTPNSGVGLLVTAPVSVVGVVGVVRIVAVIAGLASLAPVQSDAAAVARGSLAGKVFDKQTEALVPDVTVDAYALTSGEEFRVVTDAKGGYVVEDAPTSVYSFTLAAGGEDYVVQERLDLRVGMPFLLESCFELDGETNTAHVLEECDSGLVEEARVATIGPHRFLKPQDIREQDPEGQPGQDGIVEPDPESSHADPRVASPKQDPTDEQPEQPGQLEWAAEDSDLADPFMTMPNTIAHDGLECLTYDHFPLVDANIAPGDMVQISRVYFRSDKYPDFYYVDMGSENPTIDDFRAILPKPTRETERIFYYVESVDANFDSLQTPEFDPEVLEVQDCEDRGAVWFQGEEPGIVIGATQGSAAAIPPGFQAAGITGFVSSLGILTTVGGAAAATGGVVSTTGLVLVVAGGTAAAAGTTVVVTGDKEASPP
ncbi:MAG: hypothetical protein BMS9Abin37_2621 [Acidobacteriota bacterium]|nr:MAG: hypothetical protein BMS9Abin37_2621 [Acidobacteriota bacterium]